MARRIEIELTSRRDDGSWTWRAPGARQPRGVVEAAVVPAGASVGDVLRADADFLLDGIVVTAVLAPRAEAGQSIDRIEVIGSGGEAPGVSVILAPGGRRRRDEDGERRPRRSERAKPSKSGRDGVSRNAPGGAPRDSRRANQDETEPGRSGGLARSPGSSGGPPRAPRRPQGEAGSRRGPSPVGGEQGPTGRIRRTRDTDPADTGARAVGSSSRARFGGPRSSPGRREEGESKEADAGGGRPGRTRRPVMGTHAAPGDRSGRPRKPSTSTTYRNSTLAELKPEELPVAEQLLRGGMPAMRRAIEEQNSRARSEGRPEVNPEPLLTMAEKLLPRMNLAVWKDRAVMVRSAPRDMGLGEMRSIVAASSTVVLDEEGRALATELKSALDERVTALRENWINRINTALETGRIADALRATHRSPEPSTRLPADLAVRLAEAAGSAMSADLEEAEWSAVLSAVTGSPVRRMVKPAGLPAHASEALLTEARRAAGQVPGLARLLGLPIPPPPGPRRTASSGRRA